MLNTSEHIISRKINDSMYLMDIQYLIYKCDHYAPNPKLRERNPHKFPLTFPQKKGEIIFIYTPHLPYFVYHYLPHISTEFVLVTGGEDTEVPKDISNISSIILDNKFLLSWYAQNCTIQTDKLKKIPIGINHMTLEWHFFTNDIQRSIELQESDINNIIDTYKNNLRINLCHATFHLSITNLCRLDVINIIPKDLVYYEPEYINRIECWKNMIKYKFVLSPPGNGLDCHRTYEAIALGCIPILISSPLDDLLEGLPLIIVKDWSEVTSHLLNKDYSYLKNMNTDKIYLKYWINEINKYKN